MRPRRRPSRTVAVLLATAALTLSACASASSAPAKNEYKFTSGTKTGSLISTSARKPANDFSGELLAGGSMKLSDHAGKVVLLNFWATWCPPCVVETPQLDSVYRKVMSKGVEFVGIDTKDDRGAAKAFVKRHDISYPMVFDQPGRTLVKLGNIPASLPFTVLIDKAGKVAAVYLGILTPKDVEPPIDKLLAER